MNPQDPSSAQQIVAEYAGVLEKHDAANVYPSLVSDLPYSKDVIKAAILTCRSALASSNQLVPELRDFLEVAYVSLADYVDAEMAILLREYRASSNALSDDPRRPRDKMESPAWNVVAGSSHLAGTIARAIADETEQLRREFSAANR